MMKETKIMKAFEQYIKKFDMNKGNVKAMYFHSIRMMGICKDIANNIGIFTDEEVVVCGLIGLFHNIGLFSDKNKSCLYIEDNADVTKETINVLFDRDNLMRSITDNTKYDDIIKIAIYCQNKAGLPQGFDSKTLHFCMVLKDANVLENFRVVADYSFMDMEIDNYPNDMVYGVFKEFKVVSSRDDDNDADKILEVMSSIFGVYYSYSYCLLKAETSVNKLIGALKINDKSIYKFFHEIGSVLNLYIEKKISG